MTPIVKPLWVVPRSEVQLTLEEVGKGRWTIIQVAEYKGQRVAARCIYSQLVSKKNHKLFQENLHVVAKIQHPNILAFLGAVVEGDPIILTELMPTNLRKVLDMGKLENYQISDIAVDIARALFFLHTIKPEPVIHGDLVSSSILLQKKSGIWKAKLSDFVTAKFFQEIISTGIADEISLSPTFSEVSQLFPSPTSPPTYPFSHPRSLGELPSIKQTSRMATKNFRQSQTAIDMQDDSILTLQRDVYSFGLLLVEMCTGTTPLDVSLNFLVESITWSDMIATVKTCTEYNPALRPSMESVLTRLKSIHEATISIPSKHAFIKSIV